MGTRMRLAVLPTQPMSNENHRLVRTVFKRAELLNSSILAIEHSTYFAGGRSPVHAEVDSEEIIFFRRGHGQVLVGERYVDVQPGSAVAIPSGVKHHVVNTGQDVLDHILISGDLSKVAPQLNPLPAASGFVIAEKSFNLARLACRKFEVAPGQESEAARFAGRETVYAISGGFAVVHVGLADGPYEWQYAMDASNCFWLPPGLPHRFRNVGHCSLSVLGFTCISGEAKAG